MLIAYIAQQHNPDILHLLRPSYNANVCEVMWSHKLYIFDVQQAMIVSVSTNRDVRFQVAELFSYEMRPVAVFIDGAARAHDFWQQSVLISFVSWRKIKDTDTVHGRNAIPPTPR
jgi:hypothetical protein